jgi:alkane 1-monooxygenase
LLTIGVLAGPPIAGLVILQAALAQYIVAAVNFFEHWGIVRRTGKVTAVHAWDCTAPMSHYALLGLSFHADHHVRASRSFDRLELHDVSPKLPRGYFTMIGLVLLRGEHVRRLLAAELTRATAIEPPRP